MTLLDGVFLMILMTVLMFFKKDGYIEVGKGVNDDKREVNDLVG